jgi:hypothetical protein
MVKQSRRHKTIVENVRVHKCLRPLDIFFIDIPVIFFMYQGSYKDLDDKSFTTTHFN